MKFSVVKISLASVVLALMLSLISFLQANAVGISPPILKVENILRDTSQKQTVRLFKDENDLLRDVTYRVSASGEYAHYLEAPETFVIPAGQLSETYSFQISPQNAATGNYDVELNFMESRAGENTQLSSTEGSGSKILAGVDLLINFSVSGEEKVDFEINNLHVSDTEIGALATISVFIKNKGNVDWKPERIRLSFENINDKSQAKIESNILGSEIGVVSPSSSSNLIIGTKAELLEGQYQASARFYYNSEMVATLKSNTFSVFKQGTLAQEARLLGISTNKTSFSAGERVKLDAQIRNTGEVAAQAILVAEIYDKQQGVIDLVRSAEFTIEQGLEKRLSEFITLPHSTSYLSQNYTIDVYTEYGHGQKRSITRSIQVTVQGSPLGKQILVLLLLVVILSAGFVWYKKKKSLATVNFTYNNH